VIKSLNKLILLSVNSIKRGASLLLAFYCMGEFELIDKYFKVPHARKDVVMGPGDDCALLTLPPTPSWR
jgi:hypothetical protein